MHLKYRVWSVEEKSWRDYFYVDVVPGALIYSNKENYIIQQYIGIKDKSKKEIFEGDIVHFDDSEISSKPCIGDFEVCYETDLTLVSAPSFILFNSRGAVLSMLGDIKVIGNIIENPELLK